MKPDTSHWIIIWIILLIAGYLTLQFFYPLDWPIQLLVTTNLITFILVLIDKMSAYMRIRRVPERVLYIATFFGGSIGMLIGMFLFRHKTRKVSFQFVVGLLVLVQIGFVVWYLNGFKISVLSF